MELIRALGELAEAPGPEQVRTARLLELPGEPTRNEYTELFVVQLYPYASVYLSPDGQLGGQVQEHIAGFWRMLRLPVPRDPDHIATLFATYDQLLAQKESLAEQMRHAFLWEHIVSWLLPFAARVRELGSTVYRAWGTLVLDAFEVQAVHVGQPSLLPLQLRNAPPLPVEHSTAALVEMLFSPVRCGCILTRADLSRCARELEIKTRVAERRYTLASLIDRDRVRVCTWLSKEAARQADLMRSMPGQFEMISAHWEHQAMASAALLNQAAHVQLPPVEH